MVAQQPTEVPCLPYDDWIGAGPVKAKQEKRTISLVAVVVLTAAAIRLVNLNLLTENTLLRDFIRVVLQISLISAWGL